MSNEQKVSKTPKAPKVKFFDGVKAEFKKIIWPDKDTLLKQSVAVVFVSIVMLPVRLLSADRRSRSYLYRRCQKAAPAQLI